MTLPDTTTALDIPEPINPVRDITAEIRAHKNFEDLRSGPDSPYGDMLVRFIAEGIGIEPDVVLRVVNSGESDSELLQEARGNLLNEEWRAFLQAIDRPDERTGSRNFVVSSTALVPNIDTTAHASLRQHIKDVVLVHRLREIRVLHGFRRHSIASKLVDVDPDRKGRARWLPAIESFGEGVFITLDPHRLAEWEQGDLVRERTRTIEQRRRDSLFGERLPDCTPRFVLLHTLAHVLMRRLAHTCGYAAASLRERVYARGGDNPEAGILIYTSAGDSEGTLGGLVRQGEAPRLSQTIFGALEEAAWCSSDPICGESRGQGLGSLNLAGCHGCCLVAETSCERSNVLLDRVLLVGDNQGTTGYFESVVQDLRETVVGS